MIADSEKLFNSRYRIVERIGIGGMGAVYRAHDLLEHHDIALKRMTLTSYSEEQAETLRYTLAQEFKLLASLRHPHIIGVLDYGFDDDRLPFYTMPLLADAQSIVDYSRSQTIGARIRLIIQMLDALAYLHRRDILHRDIKPDNVLVVHGQVQLVDFGLAVMHGQSSQNDPVGTPVGTMAYMAPEVMQGEPTTAASDIYAAGIIAYEMLAGEHPFNTRSYGDLMHDVLNKEPDINALPLNNWQQSLVTRMLAKDPAVRISDAYRVRSLWSKSIGQTQLLKEATGESYLYTAPFIGREAELRLLQADLRDTFRAYRNPPRGRARLIGGESGVGKTRLLDELRTTGLVSGALVLRGRCTPNGDAYQPWPDVLRRLVLGTPLTRFEASVLKQLVPDIERILGLTVPDAPGLGIVETHERIKQTIVDLFTTQTRAILLLLEDLQWASNGIDVLRRLTAFTADLPVVIVGTYRTDLQPGLPQRLKDMNHLALAPLGRDHIHDLSRAIIGDDAATPDVIAYLERASNGNPFFVIETIRALAETAGSVEAIGQSPLPADVLADGIQGIARRRLAHLSEKDQPLVRVAAVIGRYLDLDMLQHIAPLTDMPRWLATCQDAAILELSDGAWRFTHDQLRAGIIEAASDELPHLHRQAAEAIEALYGSSPQHAEKLAHHWQQAGDMARATTYFQQAASHDFSLCRFQAALGKYQRLGAMPGSDGIYGRIMQGECLHRLGRYRQARRELEGILRDQPDERQRRRALVTLSEVLFDQGEYKQAAVMLHGLQDYVSDGSDNTLLVRVLSNMGRVYWRLGDLSRAERYVEQCLFLSRRIGDSTHYLQALNLRGVLALTEGKSGHAEASFREVYRQAQEVGNHERIISALNNLGKLALMRGQLKEARRHLMRAIDMAAEIDHTTRTLALVNLAEVDMAGGDLQNAHDHLREAMQLVVSAAARPLTLAVLMGFAEWHHARGDTVQALALLRKVRLHPAYNTDTARELQSKLATWGIAEENLHNARETDTPHSLDPLIKLLK